MNLTEEQLAKITDPNHPIMLVIERMNKIQDLMAKNDPEIKTHLREIWKACQQYEELAHILTPEQIGVYTKGMQKYSGQYLVVEGAGKKKKSGKTTVDDID